MSNDLPNCLVTGASGYIGKALCQALHSRQAQFSAVQRRAAVVPGAQRNLCIDLDRENIHAAELDGVETVIHLAGLAHARASAEEHERLNYRAVLDLARVAAESGVRHFLFVSSVKAMGPAPGVDPRAEDDLNAPRSAYGLAKRAAESDLEALAAETSMAVSVIRPALVFGPGQGGNLGQLTRLTERGFLALPDEGRRSMISLDDLVAVLISVMLAQATGYRCFIATGGDYSARDIQQAWMESLGRKLPAITLPLGLCKALFALRDLGGTQGDESSFQKLFGTELYDGSSFESSFGWRPAQSPWDAYRETREAREVSNNGG